MPAYGSTAPRAIYPGDVAVMSNAALPGLKTQAFAVVSMPGDSANVVCTIVNGSAQTLTVQFAVTDTDASYKALKDLAGGQAVTVPAATAGVFQTGAGFIRGLLAGDPVATTITISR